MTDRRLAEVRPSGDAALVHVQDVYPTTPEDLWSAIAEGDGARLVVEDRGLPTDAAPFHAAGWQAHLEDLGAALAGRPASDWHARWQGLMPSYLLEGGPAA